MVKQAIFKFNGGAGALLCSNCHRILKTLNEMTENEKAAFRGEKKIEGRYCDKCRKKV